MNKSYVEWLDYYENATKEDVIQDMILDINSIKEQKKKIERLNNIINRVDNFVDRTIEIIKQQPSGNDEWILERLNGIKQCLKDSDK